MPAPRPDPAPRFLPLFLAALAVRVAVVATGIAVSLLDPVSPPDGWNATQHALAGGEAAGLLEPWYRGDALWLVRIARHGYATADGPDGQHGAAFLPLLPAILAASDALGLNLFWVGVIVPNIAAAA